MISLLFAFFTFSGALLPVPDRAKPVCQNCSTVGFDVVPLGDGIWTFTDGAYWALAIQNYDVKPTKKHSYHVRGEYHLQASPKKTPSLTIVDAWQGDGYMKAVDVILSLAGANTVKYLIYSHAHTDHIGSASEIVDVFPNVKIIGHAATKKTLQSVNDPRRPIPDKTFTDALDVPEAGLELRFLLPAHSNGDIAIYHPDTKTLMFVDVVFPRWAPFWNYAITVDIPAFYDVYDKLLAYDFNTFIGGHLTRLGDRADVQENLDFINDIKTTGLKYYPTMDFGAVGASIGAFDPSSPNYGNFWQAFNVMLDTAAQSCAQEIIDRWGTQLGGVDVWSYSHCWAILESLRVDFAV